MADEHLTPPPGNRPDASDRLKAQVASEFDRRALAVTKADVDRALDKEDSILANISGPLEQYIDSVKSFFRLLRAYVNGDYREVPWATVAAITVTLLYILSPIDLIPDFIPVIGQLDDLLLIGLALKLIDSDIKAFTAWEQRLPLA